MILEELIEKLQALPGWARNERIICDDGVTMDRDVEGVEVNYGCGPGVTISISMDDGDEDGEG